MRVVIRPVRKPRSALALLALAVQRSSDFIRATLGIDVRFSGQGGEIQDCSMSVVGLHYLVCCNIASIPMAVIKLFFQSTKLRDGTDGALHAQCTTSHKPHRVQGRSLRSSHQCVASLLNISHRLRAVPREPFQRMLRSAPFRSDATLFVVP